MIRWLDIGSGKNPFYFSLPDSITVNNSSGANDSSWECLAYDPEPDLIKSADKLEIPPDCVKNILFHFSVGNDSRFVISPKEFASTVANAYSWLVPGGGIFVRSQFKGKGSFNPKPFILGFLAAGFRSSNIDIVDCSDEERLPLPAREVLYYWNHHQDSAFFDDSSFLIAHKD